MDYNSNKLTEKRTTKVSLSLHKKDEVSQKLNVVLRFWNSYEAVRSSLLDFF